MNQRPQPPTRKKIEHYSYSLSDNIGAGYSSKVFKGRDDATMQPCALKVIDMHALKNQVHRTLLMNETQCLKDLKGSSHCIRLLNVYTTKNNTYIITELCQEGDLSKLIAKGSMNQQRVLQLIKEVVKGYLQINDKNIVHRDLKPANIFMSAEGLKLADFGFAFKTSLPEPTKFSYNVGSPLYMSPEALSQNLYSCKSDIWALGIIMFEMLTGRTPWTARSERQLAQKIRAEPIGMLIPESLSYPSKKFLKKCLEINLQQRMTPSELRTWLEQINCKVSNSNNKENNQSSEPKTINFRQHKNVILSQINYARFMHRTFKLLESIEACTDQRFNLQMRFILAKWMNLTMNRLTQMTQFRLNPLKLADVTAFFESPQFGKVSKLVEQYRNKFKGLYDSMHSKLFRADLDVRRFFEEQNLLNQTLLITRLTQTIEHLRSIARRNLVQGQNYQIVQQEKKDQVVCLDYLITLFQLNMVECRIGQQFDQFESRSQIGQIMGGRATRISSQHINKIESKIIKLQL